MTLIFGLKTSMLHNNYRLDPYFDKASRYELFMRRAYRFEYTTEKGLSLATFLNYLQAEAGIPLSFLLPKEQQLACLKEYMGEALNLYGKFTLDERQKVILERSREVVAGAKGSEELMKIIEIVMDQFHE